MVSKVKKYLYTGSLFFTGLLFVLQGCIFMYSFSKSSLPSEIETFSIKEFRISSTKKEYGEIRDQLTKELRSQISKQTRLVEVETDGDLQFGGAITQVYAREENTLIQLLVFYQNKYQKEMSFTNKTYSESEDNYKSKVDASPTEKPEKLSDEVVRKIIIQQLVEKILEDTINQW